MNLHYLCLALCLVAVYGQNSGLENIVATRTNLLFEQPNQTEISFFQPWDVRFTYPVDIQSDGNSDWLYVAEQVGTIKAFLTNETVPTIVQFLDIHDLVVFDGLERGLLGLVFDPNFANNSWFYVCYTNPNIVISRFTATNATFADPSSEVKIISWVHPFENNNGGQLVFGPDGFLYTASGDGGAFGDPLRLAQNPASPLGKILRIDVSSLSSNTTTNMTEGNNSTTGNSTTEGTNTTTTSPFLIQNYQVPSDNPFINQTAFLPEIWAWGFKNPFRFSFDKVSGNLWLGDVGENSWDEIDIVPVGSNAGWSLLEGPACFYPPRNCSLVGIEPIFALNHSMSLISSCSSCEQHTAIVGGHVYRGPTISSLNGSYIFAEYFSATVFVLSPTSSDPFNNTVSILGSLPKAEISTFGLDKNGELYFADHKNGFIYGLMSNAVAPSETTGTSDTGSTDTGSTDTGSSDTGSSDTGSSDTGSTDTGVTA